ncbi:MAG: hypothetical protein WCQ72_04975, partial [Eubacteriales bacterium]
AFILFMALYSVTAARILSRILPSAPYEAPTLTAESGSAPTPAREDQPDFGDTKLMFSDAPLYRVAPYGDIIGVYDTAGALVSKIDVRLDSLPSSDIAYIKEGILLYSESELDSLICDYTG